MGGLLIEGKVRTICLKKILKVACVCSTVTPYLCAQFEWPLNALIHRFIDIIVPGNRRDRLYMKVGFPFSPHLQIHRANKTPRFLLSVFRTKRCLFFGTSAGIAMATCVGSYTTCALIRSLCILFLADQSCRSILLGGQSYCSRHRRGYAIQTKSNQASFLGNNVYRLHLQGFFMMSLASRQNEQEQYASANGTVKESTYVALFRA